MKYCPFCGADIKHSATSCESCGKTVGSKPEQKEKGGLTSRDAYERTVIPWWICAIVVGIFLFIFALIFFVKQ